MHTAQSGMYDSQWYPLNLITNAYHIPNFEAENKLRFTMLSDLRIYAAWPVKKIVRILHLQKQKRRNLPHGNSDKEFKN